MILNRKFGPYVLLDRLAVGGMAELYLAAKIGPGRYDKLCVIKTILAHGNEHPDYVRLFYREAWLAGRFTHPNVVHTYDCDVYQGIHYLVMEHMHGVTVAEMAERGAELGLPLPQEFAIQICIDACEGLHYVHGLRDDAGEALGIVHRDISPQNIFVTFGGLGKVFDFGIALTAEDLTDDPYKGMLAGKYAYMSPEQARGGHIDGRSDIFSLGVILYELTTGYRLFKRDDQIQTLRAITEDEITPPSALLDRYPRYLERIVLKALARDPDERYRDALEMSDELRKFLKISGSKPTPHLLGAYVSRLFAGEVNQFGEFRREAIAAAEAEHGREDPVAELLARMPPPTASSVEAALVDDDELVPDEGPTVAAPEGYGTPGGQVHVPERPTGPQRLAQVEIAEGTESGTYDLAETRKLAQARRTNRVLAIVSLIAIVAAIGAVGYYTGLFGENEVTRARRNTNSNAAGSQVAEGSGIVKVSSTPMGAQILLNGTAREELTPAEIELPAGETVLLELKLDGYRTYSKEVRLAEGQRRLVVDASLVEGSDDDASGPPTTAVRLVSRPEGARVVFDGQPTDGDTPLVLPEVEVGVDHVVVIDADGHETLVFPFKVDDANELELEVELNPVDAAELGTVIIDSWPRGARVMLDERFAGRTPLPPLRLTAGTYPLEVALAPYETHTSELVVEAGQTVSLNPRLAGGESANALDPLQPGEDAALVDIESDPPTEVFIESVSRGRTPLTGIEVSPGTVWIEFRDEAKGIRHIEVESFQPNDIRTLNVNIPRGRLVVESNKRATVFVDGEDVGHTPLETEVYVGEHDVRLEYDGQTRELQANISRNKTFEITESF